MEPEKYSDNEFRLDWGRTGQHLKVWSPNGVLLYSSGIGFVSSEISYRQAKWIQEHYEKQRKNYVFLN